MKFRVSFAKEKAAKKGRSLTGSHTSPQLWLAALLLALALGSQTQPANGAFSSISYWYELFVRSQDSIQLCSGEKKTIEVGVDLVIRNVTNTLVSETNIAYSNEKITAQVQANGVGSVSPDSGQTQFGAGLSTPVMTFTFTAKKAGDTILTFAHKINPNLRVPATVSKGLLVHVDDCYEAITSGAAKNFTQKYICSLEQPFELKGTVFSSASTISFFPYNRELGAFVFSSDFAGCRNIVFATYDVKFGTDYEGNITLEGAGWSYCPRLPAFRIDDIGLEIKIKPAPVCQGP